MGRSNGFSAAPHHLVERVAMGKLRVELPAKFTRPAGASVKAIDDGWIDVFHVGAAPEQSKNFTLLRDRYNK
jgi:hypothetical protein